MKSEKQKVIHTGLYLICGDIVGPYYIRQECRVTCVFIVSNRGDICHQFAHQENPQIHMWLYGAHKPPLSLCGVGRECLGI